MSDRYWSGPNLVFETAFVVGFYGLFVLGIVKAIDIVFYVIRWLGGSA